MYYTVTFTVTDEGGQDSTTRLYYPQTIPYPELEQVAQAMGSIIDTAIMGQVTAINVTTSITPINVKPTPFVYSDVEEVAQFVFYDADKSHTKFNLPTIGDNIVYGGDLIDEDHPVVRAFLDAVFIGIEVNAVVGGLITHRPIDRRGATFISLDNPFKFFRASRRR